jgi:hypothetical protein
MVYEDRHGRESISQDECVAWIKNTGVSGLTRGGFGQVVGLYRVDIIPLMQNGPIFSSWSRWTITLAVGKQSWGNLSLSYGYQSERAAVIFYTCWRLAERANWAK